MTDEQSPDSLSRRARLATRRKRLRILGGALAVALVAGAISAAGALRSHDTGTAESVSHHTASTQDPPTKPNLGKATGLAPPRALSHAAPLKLWIGGDSLAGSFGPALGQTAGATGVVDATIDYKVSSGLADNGIRDWYTHAQETMASEDPDAVVFIIGTNDASIVNSQDSNHDGVPDWEVDYRAKIDRMMMTFVGSKHRTVFWLGPPTLGQSSIDKGAKALGPVMREEAAKFAPDVVYVDTYRLFSDSSGDYSRSLPDLHGKIVQMRISDGVHFTVDGAEYLSDAVWKLLDKRWNISRQADRLEPINYTIAEGSNDYVPGVGHYRPRVHHYSSSSTTTPTVSATTVPRATTPTKATAPVTTPTKTTTPTPVTKPPATTPPTHPPATTPPTSPPPTPTT